MEWYHICFACGRSSHPIVSIFSPVPDASWITFGPRPRDKHQIAHARSFNRRPRLLMVRGRHVLAATNLVRLLARSLIARRGKKKYEEFWFGCRE